MNLNREKRFIKYVTNRVFEMLVLREKVENGESVDLDTFVDSLLITIDGAFVWSKYLNECENYIITNSIISSITHKTHEFKVFRREILKALALLNKVGVELESEDHGLGTI